MGKKDIEKAAEECRLTTAQSMGVYGQYHSIDECPEHGLSCDELVEGSFIKGAEWRINSVWHDAEEQPKNWYETCLVELGTLVSSFFTLSYYHHGGFSCLDEIHNKNIHVIKWAYLKDLTPNMED